MKKKLIKFQAINLNFQQILKQGTNTNCDETISINTVFMEGWIVEGWIVEGSIAQTSYRTLLAT